jgi:hypothetical protein
MKGGMSPKKQISIYKQLRSTNVVLEKRESTDLSVEMS